MIIEIKRHKIYNFNGIYIKKALKLPINVYIIESVMNMKNKTPIALESIEVLPVGENALFSRRENEIAHTAYRTEVMLYSAIRQGDIEALRTMLDDSANTKFVMGRLSLNDLRQMQYWAVCCVTLATRYAIQGGLDEVTAYCFSDDCILKIDEMTSANEILDYLAKRGFELTEMVAKSKKQSEYPYDIRKCINYISANLHKKITLDMLAEECNLSKDYLSLKFKVATGLRPSDYIKKQRLIAGKDMLRENRSCSEVAYYMNFCSESYFIKCFKEEFGMTPKQFIDRSL